MTDLKPFAFEDADRMYYILYDLRKDPSLAKIHLPKEGDEGPVLLRIHPEQYFVIVQELRELCENEGNEWMTSILIRPDDAPSNETDLEKGIPYIIVVHISLIGKSPGAFDEFMHKVAKMRKLVFH